MVLAQDLSEHRHDFLAERKVVVQGEDVAGLVGRDACRAEVIDVEVDQLV